MWGPVAQQCGESCAGELCEGLLPTCMRELCGEAEWGAVFHSCQCSSIRLPQEVQCVQIYSVAWDVLVICTNHYFTETGWEGAGAVRGNCMREAEGRDCVGEAGGAVRDAVGRTVQGAVTQMCVWGGSCEWGLSFHTGSNRHLRR